MKKTSHARLRRTLAMIAALTMLLTTLTACNKKGADTEDPNPSVETGTPTADTSAPTETTEAPTQATEPEVPTITATINTNNLNIRTSPSSTSPILGQLDAGDKVEIIEQQTADGFNWGRIEQGWIRLEYVTIDNQDSETTEETTPTETAPANPSGTAVNMTGTVTAAELNIRKEPSTSAESVGKYKQGNKVTITETKDGWGKTDKGWIKLSFVETKNTTTETQKPESDPKYSTLVTNGSKTALGTVKITAEALNVRYGPGNSYEVAKKVYKGNSYSYYQKDGDWFRIADGWIYTKGYTDVGTTSTENGNSGSTGTTGTGTTTIGLNIRKEGNNKADIVGGYTVGTKVTILEVKDGWGRTDKGWISMNYVKMDGTTSGSSGSTGSAGYTGSTAATGTGTTTIGLNIRKEGNNKAEVVGGYAVGTKVTILEVKDGWGRTDKGWISMKYVKMDGTTSGSTGNTSTTGEATITASELNIRKEPSTSAESVGKYVKGDKVTITETKDGWGKTDKGWISMTYVKTN